MSYLSKLLDFFFSNTFLAYRLNYYSDPPQIFVLLKCWNDNLPTPRVGGQGSWSLKPDILIKGICLTFVLIGDINGLVNILILPLNVSNTSLRLC